MPRPRPLSAAEAKRTLANRLGTRLAPRVRQLATKLGVRPIRMFLVWSVYGGEARGEGHETIVRREILPTPKIEDLTVVNYSPVVTGVMPVGTIRVRGVPLTLTFDMLKGHVDPENPDRTVEPKDFYYETMEDGRGDAVPERNKYRLAADPHRKSTQWVLMLKRDVNDNNRNGTSGVQTDLSPEERYNSLPGIPVDDR